MEGWIDVLMKILIDLGPFSRYDSLPTVDWLDLRLVAMQTPAHVI